MMAGIDRTSIVGRLLAWYTMDEIDEWLDRPQPLLGGQSPASLIAKGRGDEVRRLIDQLDEGAYL